MGEVAFLIEVGFDWMGEGRTFDLGGVRFKVFTLGCEERCVSLVKVESLTKHGVGAISLCGLDLTDLGGGRRMLMIHLPCEIRARSTAFRIPEYAASLPNLVKVRRISYALQELGGGARVRVIHRGEPRVYLLITPSQATLVSRGGEITLPPEPVLLATPGGSELRFGGVRLTLP